MDLWDINGNLHCGHQAVIPVAELQRRLGVHGEFRESHSGAGVANKGDRPGTITTAALRSASLVIRAIVTDEGA